MSEKIKRAYQKQEPIKNYNPSPKLQSFSMKSLERISGIRVGDSSHLRGNKDEPFGIDQVSDFQKFQPNENFQYRFENRLGSSNALKEKRKSRQKSKDIKENINVKNYLNNGINKHTQLEEKIRKNIYNNSNQPLIQNASDFNPTLTQGNFEMENINQSEKSIFEDRESESKDFGRMKFKMKVEDLRVSEDGKRRIIKLMLRNSKSHFGLFSEKESDTIRFNLFGRK
jgi:hypothetical protein